jgi:hypothetical protein
MTDFNLLIAKQFLALHRELPVREAAKKQPHPDKNMDFLGLPTELRLEIYRLLLVSDCAYRLGNVSRFSLSLLCRALSVKEQGVQPVRLLQRSFESGQLKPVELPGTLSSFSSVKASSV